MKTIQPKPPSLAQWLEEHRPLLKQAKKHGYSSEDVVGFLDAQHVPATTTMIQKATGRGLTKKTRQFAKQISLSYAQYKQLTEAFARWSAQRNILSKYEVIQELRHDIETALSNGYDFDDIAGILTVEGHPISGRTLKSYYKQISHTAAQIEEETIEQELSKEVTANDGATEEQPLGEAVSPVVETREPEVMEELLSSLEVPSTVPAKQATVTTSSPQKPPSRLKKTAPKTTNKPPATSGKEYQPHSLREFDESQLEELFNL